MKRILFFILLLNIISVFIAKAQLAPVGTKWTYLTADYSGLDPTKPYYQVMKNAIISDTLIDSTVYSVISPYKYFWTNESNKIFYYYKSKKRLFFDFNVKAQDTLLIDLLLANANHDTIIPFRIQIESVYYGKTQHNDSLIYYLYSNVDSIKVDTMSYYL